MFNACLRLLPLWLSPDFLLLAFSFHSYAFSVFLPWLLFSLPSLSFLHAVLCLFFAPGFAVDLVVPLVLHSVLFCLLLPVLFCTCAFF